MLQLQSDSRRSAHYPNVSPTHHYLNWPTASFCYRQGPFLRDHGRRVPQFCGAETKAWDSRLGNSGPTRGRFNTVGLSGCRTQRGGVECSDVGMRCNWRSWQRKGHLRVRKNGGLKPPTLCSCRIGLAAMARRSRGASPFESDTGEQIADYEPAPGILRGRWIYMVSRAGLEPATTALKVRCSTN